MNLSKKKILAAKTLKVGKDRIAFPKSRLEEIKEAITKQDMRNLFSEGAIFIKEIKGQKTNKKKIKSRSPGNIRKKVNVRKRTYVLATRKLRKYAKIKKNLGEISREDEIEIRKKIRNRIFKSKAHLREYMEGIKK